jgi:hypothetical protein
MNDSERTQGRATTTEQIAAAGTAGSEDGASPGQDPPGDAQAGQSAAVSQAGAGGDDVSTEDLRHSLRRYRSFFERLLAA